MKNLFTRAFLLLLLFLMVYKCAGSEKPQKIFVYFSKSVDTSFSNGEIAKENISLGQKIFERIDEAKYSIDCCVYNFDKQTIANALVEARNRGVEVRFITDNDNRSNVQVQQLEQAGIKVIDDAFPSGSSGSDAMHNKFFIFDYRDTTSTEDDWIWTGSYNPKDNEIDKNADNAIEIQDTELAKAYTIEFNEMWGSSNMIPDSFKAKFGEAKSDNISHEFTVDGTNIEVYMSPSDGTTEKIKEAIATANHEIHFCILIFSRQDISDTMKTKWDDDTNYPDFKVMGVFDIGYWNQSYSESKDMRGDKDSENPWAPPSDVLKDAVPGKLHHKYMIIDGEHPDSDPIVITGSQNWIDSAEEVNDENTLIIHDAKIANLYLQEFMARYKEAAGIQNR